MQTNCGFCDGGRVIEEELDPKSDDIDRSRAALTDVCASCGPAAAVTGRKGAGSKTGEQEEEGRRRPCLLCFVLFCFVLFCFVLFCFVLFYGRPRDETTAAESAAGRAGR